MIKMDELNILEKGIKNKLNELRNNRRESDCLKQFILDMKLSNEFHDYRIEYYRKNKW